MIVLEKMGPICQDSFSPEARADILWKLAEFERYNKAPYNDRGIQGTQCSQIGGEETVILSKEHHALSFDGKRTLSISKVSVKIHLKLFFYLEG